MPAARRLSIAKGPYGSSAGLYTLGPHMKGTKEQAPQSPQTPAELYRKSLAALDKYCRANKAGKTFDQLPAEEQNTMLKGLEEGEIKLDGVSSRCIVRRRLLHAYAGALTGDARRDG